MGVDLLGFLDLAVRLLKRGEELFESRRFGSPRGWPDLCQQRLPELMKPVDDWHKARTLLSQAKFFADRNGAADSTDKIAAAAAAEQTARARVEATEEERSAAQSALLTAWFEDRAQEYRTMRDAFAKKLDGTLRMQLAGLRTLTGRKVGTFTGESAAEVVLAFADAVIAYLIGLRSIDRLKPFHGFDPADIAGAARSEIADLIRREQHDAPDEEAERPIARRLIELIARLHFEGRHNATQQEVAEMLGCSDRSLRRGEASRIWDAYVKAGTNAPTTEPDTPIQSVQQKLQGEKAGREHREREGIG